MPRRKKVALLPRDVREELDAKLIEGAFSDYRGLVAWLKSEGYEIGKTVLQEYGGELEHRVDRIRLATEQAEALVAASPDDMSSMADAGMRLIQEQMFTALLASEEGDMATLARTMRALAESVRATLSLRQSQRNVRDETGKAAEAAAKRTGASEDTIAAIRAVYQGAGTQDSHEATS